MGLSCWTLLKIAQGYKVKLLRLVELGIEISRDSAVKEFGRDK